MNIIFVCAFWGGKFGGYQMIDTVLFDLDGTLLPLDMDKFIKIYFEEMGRKFYDLIEPKKLASHIWAATEVMVKNIEPRANEEVFMEKFGQLIEGSDLRVFQQRFDEYYDQGFLKVREAVAESPAMQKSVRVLRDKGYQLTIATNPLFPRKAIYRRIEWAGFKPSDFSYVSYYELNHYCKPQIQYYQEVLQAIHKTPEQCLMVGNDVQEDLIAGKLGLETYLITDYLIHRTGEPIQSTYQGTYQDFLKYAEGL
ncbi:MAG TPA: HAD family hydrolase [Firmicutes bacterium]|nr:HAD family hydrolase [Bacillota bacterium]